MRSSFDDTQALATALQGFRATPETPEQGHEADLHEPDRPEQYPDPVIHTLLHRRVGITEADRARAGDGRREKQDDAENGGKPPHSFGNHDSHGRSLSLMNTFRPYTARASADGKKTSASHRFACRTPQRA